VTVPLFPEYHKINGLYKRHREGPDKGRFIIGDFAAPEYEYLFHLDWDWTEKIDGTNCRILVYVNEDGDVSSVVGGRTANAQLHVDLVKVLDEIAERLSEYAHDQWYEEVNAKQEVTTYTIQLFGEGYGAGIQKGGDYRPDKSFILFDVKIGNSWLSYDNMESVGRQLDLPVVPLYRTGSIKEAIDIVQPNSGWGSAVAENPEAFEGLVGVPRVPLFDRRHNRIIVKVKRKDFE
jgi:hypothetical protein